VVSLPEGSRVEDALDAAGGFAPDADETYVNLADWVTDGQKVYFPKIGEESQDASDSAFSDGLVNINTADASLLCTLPGIGEARAQDIIAYREANGGFETPEDIMKVSGIKTSVYSKICDKIKVR
jgi:competence protein ComEA